MRDSYFYLNVKIRNIQHFADVVGLVARQARAVTELNIMSVLLLTLATLTIILAPSLTSPHTAFITRYGV